jgi:23S rRNA (uracil1939-C5)-methyltransferase
MEKKRKKLPGMENVEIIDMAAEGKALAKVDDMVVFVPFAAPGDIVDIQLSRKKHNFAEGRIVNVRKYSDDRTEPFCEHFTVCGGCKWQHIPYPVQLAYKQKQVCDNLSRIGKVPLPGTSPIIGSEQTVCYRNKLEYTFSNKRWLTDTAFTPYSPAEMNGAGFHIPGMFDKVLDIRKCWLQDDISNKVRLFIKDFCLANGYTFFDLRQQTGFIRTMIVRTSSTGEVMVIVSFFENDPAKYEKLLAAVRDGFPEITSLMYVVNSKCNDTITDLDIKTFSGKDHIVEEMEGLKFRVGSKSFYQTNSRQAYRLYCVIRDFAGTDPGDVVYDLYTGTGTIACFLSRNCRKVIGIEYVPEAIEDARTNSAINGIGNAEFFASDIKDILNAGFVDEHGHPDVIITDPPRNGMHGDVTETILAIAPRRIVYVSCNPATQARDLSLLDARYRVSRIQPVDMFPHTHHVENVLLLELKP